MKIILELKLLVDFHPIEIKKQLWLQKSKNIASRTKKNYKGMIFLIQKFLKKDSRTKQIFKKEGFFCHSLQL